MALHVGRSVATAAAAALLSLAGAVAGAQETIPVPPEGLPAETALPSPPPSDRSVHPSLGSRRPGPTDTPYAGRLKGWTALALKEGEGRLVIDGVARQVKRGQTVEGYVVKAVGPGRVVLEGAASGPGGATGPVLAVITFDAQGRSRVRLVFESDPTAALSAPPPGR